MTNNKYESAKQYIENCKREGKREGKQTERERMNDALYGKQGCLVYTDDDRGQNDSRR